MHVASSAIFIEPGLPSLPLPLQAKLQPVVSKALAGGVKRALAGPVRTAITRKPVVVGTAAVATLAGAGSGCLLAGAVCVDLFCILCTAATPLAALPSALPSCWLASHCPPPRSSLQPPQARRR